MSVSLSPALCLPSPPCFRAICRHIRILPLHGVLACCCVVVCVLACSCACVGVSGSACVCAVRVCVRGCVRGGASVALHVLGRAGPVGYSLMRCRKLVQSMADASLSMSAAFSCFASLRGVVHQALSLAPLVQFMLRLLVVLCLGQYSFSFSMPVADFLELPSLIVMQWLPFQA